MSGLRVKLAKALLGAVPARPTAEYLPMDRVTHEHGMRRAQGELEDERAGGFGKFFGGLGLAEGGSVLDFGCGYGGRTVEFQRLAGGLAVGLDVDPRMMAPAIAFARSAGAGRVAFAAGVGEELPFADASFDHVLSYDVLEHVHEPERCLAECFRVLKPGGSLMLVFPPYYHPTGAHLEGYVSHLPWATCSSAATSCSRSGATGSARGRCAAATRSTASTGRRSRPSGR
jgi:SAM-dependent methyltransferase